MEYIKSDGTKVIIDGDKIQYGDGPFRKNVIGANFTNGTKHGGYLSSFNGFFDEEVIGIETGLGDIVNAQLGDIKDAYQSLKTKVLTINNTNILELSKAVLETVDEYFNGLDNISTRMDYYYPADFEESKDNKISNLKGTGAAMCVERSALSQNLLKSMGINSFFKTSGIIKNGNKEVHSYNLIEFNDKYYIFDSSMPNLIDGKANPLIAEIDKETFSLLSSPLSDIGISVTVSHYNPYRNTDVSITYDSGRDRQIEVNPLDKSNNHELGTMLDENNNSNDLVEEKQYVKSNGTSNGFISLTSIVLVILSIACIVLVGLILNLLLK